MEDRDKGKQAPYETGAVPVTACKPLFVKRIGSIPLWWNADMRLSKSRALEAYRPVPGQGDRAYFYMLLITDRLAKKTKEKKWRKKRNWPHYIVARISLRETERTRKVRGSCARLIVKFANSKSKSQSTYEGVHSRRAGYSLWTNSIISCHTTQ